MIEVLFRWFLHEEVLSIEQLTTANQLSFEADPTADASLLIKGNYQKKENEQHNQTYAIEEQILKFVRTGDTEGLQNLKFNESNFHLGITGSTALRQLKNNIIITTTICTRAAIEGGLDYDTAYQLSDYFIQTSERLYELLEKVSYTFTEKVAIE